MSATSFADTRMLAPPQFDMVQLLDDLDGLETALELAIARIDRPFDPREVIAPDASLLFAHMKFKRPLKPEGAAAPEPGTAPRERTLCTDLDFNMAGICQEKTFAMQRKGIRDASTGAAR